MNIQKLLNPKSIAIIGVSENLNKLNGRILKLLVEKNYDGKIFPINPKYKKILNFNCYDSILNIKDKIDLAVITVPSYLVLSELEKVGKSGVKTALIFSSGFSEIGKSGKLLEKKILNISCKFNIRICGPNCLGVINAFDKVFATFSQYGMKKTNPGPIGFVSQSGAFGTAIAALARERDLGLGYFVNTGNETDISFSECMEYILNDKRIKVGAGYIEGVTDPTKLVNLARTSLKTKKPIVITKVGKTKAGAKAAASHTGAISGNDEVFSKLIAKLGILRAKNEEHLLDIVDILSKTEPPKGENLGIITMSGGAGVQIADKASELGLKIPRLQKKTENYLKKDLSNFASIKNPIDITAQFIADPQMLRNSVKHVLSDSNIHIGIIWLQLMDGFVEILKKTFYEIKKENNKPFVVCWVAAPNSGLKALRDMNICALRAGEATVDAIKALTDWGNILQKHNLNCESSNKIEKLIKELHK